MAISKVCKLEFKSNVDKVQKQYDISRYKAISLLADELGLLSETARKIDQRARGELGQIVPKQKNPLKLNSKPKLEKPQHGGARLGSGRKKKVSQNKAWGKVVRDLSKLEKYMQQRCELGADIDTSIKHQFYDHIDTLQIFLNDFEKE